MILLLRKILVEFNQGGPKISQVSSMGRTMFKRRPTNFYEKLRYKRRQPHDKLTYSARINIQLDDRRVFDVYKNILIRSDLSLQMSMGGSDHLPSGGLHARLLFQSDKKIGPTSAINIHNETDNSMEVIIDGNRAMQLQKLLRDRNIPFEVTVTDLNTMARPRSPTSGRSPSPTKRIIDWNDFYPLHTINNFMDALEKLYPSTCTVSVIGHTVEGRTIKMLKISNSDARNTGVWLDGTIHAREWISASVVTYIADYIARNFEKLPESITNKDWYMVPVVNPDGYNYTHTTDRMWRKNRARIGNAVCGVDLNRNFGHNWGRSGFEYSSMDPNHNNYRGHGPFSEPETAAVKDLILYSGIPFKIFLTFHAYSEVISFPWCFTADPCENYVDLLEGGTTIAKAIYETNGRMYKVGNFKDLMYYACGTSIDWSYGTARIPYTYLIELRSKEHKFLLPREEILDCCKEVLNGVKALAEYVDKKECVNCTLFAKKLR